MKLADTNVLLDLLGVTSDRAARGQAAVQAIADDGEPMIVTEVVLAELFWVLGSTFGMSGARSAALVGPLLDSAELRAWDEELSREALAIKSRWPRLDIADCLLAARSAISDDEVITHDRRLRHAIESERDSRRPTP